MIVRQHDMIITNDIELRVQRLCRSNQYYQSQRRPKQYKTQIQLLNELFNDGGCVEARRERIKQIEDTIENETNH